jgi:UPF0755 protein
LSSHDGGDGLDDDDIWSTPEPDPAPRPASPATAGRAPAGPSRPPRRSGPRRPVAEAAATAPATAAPAAAAGDADLPPDDGHDYVDLPPEGSLPKWLGVLIVFGLIIGLIVGGAWWWYGKQIDPSGSPGRAVSVQVPEGSSLSGIGSILESEGVISNAMVFNFYAGRKDAGPFQAGSYQLRQNSDFDLVLRTLAAGPKAPLVATVTKVTIPEGYTVAKVLARIHEKVPRLAVADLQAALDGGQVPTSLKPADQRSYEGLLFPATYEVTAKMTAVEVLTLMAQEMEQRADALGIQAAQEHIKRQWGLDLTAYDMLKVASMIQFEAAIPADAPKIATVTYNRMEKGTPLGFDSTSIYEAALKGVDTVDYEVDTPYNTRVNAGLPPTPIAAPGEYALTGAMEPEDGPWLYFVLTDAKEVTFTVTYDDFLKAKQLCRERDLGCG